MTTMKKKKKTQNEYIDGDDALAMDEKIGLFVSSPPPHEITSLLRTA
jgi:hypothetical protein